MLKRFYTGVMDIQNQESQTEQSEQQNEQPDPIVLLGQELQQIREALGLGENAASSSLMQRLSNIESKLSQPERERNLPSEVTWSQLSSRKFLLANKIDLADISSGRIKVIQD